MNPVTSPASLDADMAAILGLEEAFFMPAQAKRDAPGSRRPVLIISALTVGLIAAVSLVRAPSSLPAPSRPVSKIVTQQELSKPRGMITSEALVTSAPEPSAALIPTRAPMEAHATTKPQSLRSAMVGRGQLGLPQSPLATPQSFQDPAPTSPALINQRGVRAAQAAAGEGAIEALTLQPPVDRPNAPASVQTQIAHASERRDAIDAIRALRR